MYFDVQKGIMIRVIFGVIWVAVFLIVTLPFLGLMELLWLKYPHLWEKGCFRLIQFGFRVLGFICGVRTTTIGMENITDDGPVLYVANHRSFFDVIMTYPQFRSITGFVAKSGFRKVPILPIWIGRLYGEFLVKDDIRQNLESILKAIDHVKQGISMFIFPEGMRSTGEDERELLEFHEGSFKIATKAGCPIVPVAICGSREIFEAHFPFVRAGHVVIEYGKPIETRGLSRQELRGIGARVREEIQEMVIKNHELVSPGSGK